MGVVEARHTVIAVGVAQRRLAVPVLEALHAAIGRLVAQGSATHATVVTGLSRRLAFALAFAFAFARLAFARLAFALAACVRLAFAFAFADRVALGA